MQAGIIGVQGDVSEHKKYVSKAGEKLGLDINTKTIREKGKIPSCDLLIIPGGESTTISNLINKKSIRKEIIEHNEKQKLILATCAGLILLSSNPNDSRVEQFDILDISVKRNAFGRQKESFETEIEIKGLEKPFPAVFIRAPIIEDIGEKVEVLSRFKDKIVAVKQNNIIGTSFHPELSSDYRIHKLIFENVPNNRRIA